MCSIFGLALLVSEAINWSQNFAATLTPNSIYKDDDGAQDQPSECTGVNQSPINICRNDTTLVRPSDELIWTRYDLPPDAMTLTNDGKTIILHGTWAPGLSPYLEGGALPAETRYHFHNIAFHWGPSDEEGSEHTFNMTRFALEIQMVHLKEGFTTLSEAASSRVDDAIAIISYLFEAIPVDNPFLDHITNNLMKVVNPHSTVSIPPFPLTWFFDPFSKCYYTYKGSLTQPPWSEVVNWIVLTETLPVSARQVQLFRNLQGDNGPMLNTSRPVQLGQNRTVYLYA